MRKRKIGSLFMVLIAVLMMTGCTSNTALVNIEKKSDNTLGRSCVLWTGTYEDTIEIEEAGDIIFSVDMKEGKVTFILQNSAGEEVYSLSKEGEFTGSVTYTAEKSEKYVLIQKGEKFKGSYKVIWGDAVGEEEE